MGLMMCDGKFVSRDEVALVSTPSGTESWKPVPHMEVIEATWKPEADLKWGGTRCVLHHLTLRLFDSFRLFDLSPDVQILIHKH